MGRSVWSPAMSTSGRRKRGSSSTYVETDERSDPTITEQARHQYVLGYVSNNEVRGELPVVRKIDVEVNRPGLSIHHRKSYLQYPPR